MKTPSIIRFLLVLTTCVTGSLEAQNFPDELQSDENFHLSIGTDHSTHPVHLKAEGIIPESRPQFVIQNMRNLRSQETTSQRVESVVDLDILKQPSIYQKLARGNSGAGIHPEDASLRDNLELMSATYREPSKVECAPDSHEIALAVKQRILMNPSVVLETVESEVAANPSCACEIVKSAIQASLADSRLVVEIVEVAIRSSPENMRLISQCAIAAAPESLPGVQALLAKLEPNGGDGQESSKSDSKSAKTIIAAIVEGIHHGQTANPLDLPPTVVVVPQLIVPVPITQVNP